MNNPLEDFRDALAKAGINYAGELIADGKLHRFKAYGDQEKNSWYVLYAGPPIAGAFACWKRDVKNTWCERSTNLSQEDWARVRQQWRDAAQVRVKAEAERQAKAAKLAAWILKQSRPARTLHRYLTRKGVNVFGDLREYRNALVLPLRSADGELYSLQFIGVDGQKMFLRGGKIAGCFFTLADKADAPLVICEGLATGASIHAATGFAVVCAMNCHNLKVVAESQRKLYPHREVIIAGDDDCWRPEVGNPGVKAATEAARTIHARLVVPQFKDATSKPTDFNDLHKQEGLGAVKTQIVAAAPTGRPRLVLPGSDRPDSIFTAECGRVIGAQQVWFLKGGLVVEVRLKTFTEKIHHLAFHVLRPIEVCTGIEDFIEVGTLVKEKFVPCSMSDRRANVLINSPQFKRELPEITRVLDYRIPVLHDGQLIYPAPGFDARFGIYTNPNAPAIINMDQRTAKMWLHELLKDFCFDGEQSLTHAIARLLTPMCRALMGWDARGPFWIFTANRERLGKDYLAVVAGLLFDGYPNEDAPLESRDSAETKKRITSAIMAGRNRMHFANCSGHICDAALEQAITARCWSDRVLGGNTEISLPNEIEFSMSGNAGVVTYRGDLAHRARHIRLSYAEENPNGRKFTNPDLHHWVQQNRPNILSALAALVKVWFIAGQPSGTNPFASFPAWAKVVGGVMQANSLGDPCQPEIATQVGGDEEFRDMKILFRLAHEKFKVTRVEQKKITSLIVDGDTQLFSWLNLAEREGQTRFGKALRRYDGRVLDGIVLKVHTDTTRPKFSFEPWQTGAGPSANPADLLLQAATPKQSADVANLADLADLADLLPPKYILTSGDIQGEEAEPPRNEQQKVREVGKVSVATPGLITNPTELAGIAAAIAGSDTPVALDIETHGADTLNPYRGEIRLLTLAIPGRTPWLLDLKAIGYDLSPLKPVLESAMVVGHNLKFDLLWLRVKCDLRIPYVFCTMTAARLLHAGTNQKSDLGAVVERYLDINLAKDQGRSDWGLDPLTPAQIQYASDDVAHLHQLKAVLETELDDARLNDIARLEMALLPVVVDMEATGYAVDRSRLETMLAEAEHSASSAKATTLTLFNKPGLNLNSTKQLIPALTDLGIEVESTNAETLAAIDHPAVKSLVCYREATKRAQMLRKLLDAIEMDGRIHARFNPMGTATGRFSSSSPNLQNVGRGQPRSCFIAQPSFKLVVVDYSQIELRAAAALAEEPRMLAAYKQGDDLHLQTAALVLGREATKADRQLAKAVNFGLLYGQGTDGLARYARQSYGVELTSEQAADIRRNFFDSYEGLGRWHQTAWDEAAGDALESRTRLGRRRLLEDAGNSKWKRFTTLINTPVQGGCADGMKLAMVKLASLLPEGARLVSCVHDELIVEAPEASAEAVKQLVIKTMVSEMQTTFPEVPIEVEANVCSDWGGKSGTAASPSPANLINLDPQDPA